MVKCSAKSQRRQQFKSGGSKLYGIEAYQHINSVIQATLDMDLAVHNTYLR
jgi:hypothetical protein